MARRSLAPFAVAALVGLVACDVVAAPLLSWVATARIQSGNTTLTDSPDPPDPTGPDDSTGFLEANGVNVFPPSPPIDAGALARYGISSGILAATAGFDASSNAPDDLRVYKPFAGASALYRDDLTVTSESLEMGTPVQVRFAFALAWSAEAASTQSRATTAAHVSATTAGVDQLPAGDNRYFLDLETPALIHNGIFTGDQQAAYMVDALVGFPFVFALSIDVDSYGTVSPSDGLNNAANGWSTLALSFGGEVTTSGAEIQSALLAGPFPPASGVSPAAAAASYPTENPFDLPEPARGLAMAAAFAALAGLGARRSRSTPWASSRVGA